MKDKHSGLEASKEMFELRNPYETETEEDGGKLTVSQNQETVKPFSGASADEVMSPYFREMRSIKLLTPEQELSIGREIKEAQDALMSLTLEWELEFVPLRLFQKKLAAWGEALKSGRDPIEKIFKDMDTVFRRAASECQMMLKPADLEVINEYRILKDRLIDAMGRMVAANLRLAVNIAKRYANRGLSLPDLIQEGNLGLMKAVARFDYTTGHRFSTFASWWIRQTVSRALSDQGRTIRVPVHFLEVRTAFYRTYFELVKELKREPTIRETAEKSGLSLEKINSIIQMSREPVSLEAPISDDGDQLGDLIENEETTNPLSQLQENELTGLTWSALDCLTEREQKIIMMRFGLGDEDPCTLEEVGKTLHISRERVRQLEKRALSRLRQSPQQGKLKSYLAG